MTAYEMHISDCSQTCALPIFVRQALFTDILTEVHRLRPSIAVPTPQRGNWISFSSGPFGYWCLSVIADGRLRVEAYIDTNNRELNKELFDTSEERRVGRECVSQCGSRW